MKSALVIIGQFLASNKLWYWGLSGSTGAIDCYTCTSMGGSDRKCEDPAYKEFLNITPNCQVTNFGLYIINLVVIWCRSSGWASNLCSQGPQVRSTSRIYSAIANSLIYGLVINRIIKICRGSQKDKHSSVHRCLKEICLAKSFCAYISYCTQMFLMTSYMITSDEIKHTEK